MLAKPINELGRMAILVLAKLTFGLALILAALIFVLASFAAEPKQENVGCFKDEDYQGVRFNRDCLNEKTDGYFKFPNIFKPVCMVAEVKFYGAHESKHSYFSMEVSASALLGTPSNHIINFEIRALDKINGYFCNGGEMHAIMQNLMSKKIEMSLAIILLFWMMKNIKY